MIYPDLSPTVQLHPHRERRLRRVTELLALPVLMVAILQFIYLTSIYVSAYGGDTTAGFYWLFAGLALPLALSTAALNMYVLHVRRRADGVGRKTRGETLRWSIGAIPVTLIFTFMAQALAPRDRPSFTLLPFPSAVVMIITAAFFLHSLRKRR